MKIKLKGCRPIYNHLSYVIISFYRLDYVHRKDIDITK